MRFVWAIWGPPKPGGTVTEASKQQWNLADFGLGGYDFGEKSVKMQLAPISTKLKSSHHIPERRLYAKFQGPSSKNDRVVRWPRRQPYYYLGYIVKVGWACSAGSNGPVDPPYHLGPLIEWYLHGFRGFGGVWGGLGSIPSDFGPTGLIGWTPDLGLSEVEKSTSSDLYET